MQTLHSIKALKATIKDAKANALRVGFVPTMGNLHEGHLRLIDVAREHCDYVVCSIFVNPMQFGANEDLDSYPRTLEDDQHKLITRNTDLLFAPSANEMYPNGMQHHVKINMPHMAGVLCGKSRPTHFEGVCTVVSKLFNQVEPDVAVFGKKDMQQLLIIKQMTMDLCLPIEVIGVDTEREQNGLALSSRNSLLTAKEKEEAQVISQILTTIKREINSGNVDYQQLLETGMAALEETSLKTDYLEIRDLLNFETAKNGQTYENLGIFAAAFAEKTRLIDNTTTREIN